jgi:RNA polymerase sigma factor (sigma-70 family)
MGDAHERETADMNGTRFSPILHYLRRLAGPAGGGQTDEQLLSRFIAQRDESAFEALVQRHGPLVWGVCRRSLADLHAAEDAFQATFLVLARRAAAIVKRASLRSWLHGVACRIAQRARERGQREQNRLAAIDPAQLAAPSDADAWRQLQPILDEELNRLPDKYRAPLLLCYLEGKTRDEAAQELGWSEGAVKGRLERGRDLLRDRLTRRGLPLSAALLVALPAEGSASPIPTALAAAATTSALGGTASVGVTALSEGVIQAMLWTKWKMSAAIVLALGLLGAGTGTATWYALGGSNERAVRPAEPVRAAPDQRAALRLGGNADLPAIAQADRLVVEWAGPSDQKRLTLVDPETLKKIRGLLTVESIPPSAGETRLNLSFYQGEKLLRKVWVYARGEWGVVRPQAPHWTLGMNAELVPTVEKYAAAANAIQQAVANADLAFVGKVVSADLVERPLPGFIGVLHAPVEYAVTRKLRGEPGQRPTVQVPLRGADLKDMPPNYLDAQANRLNAEVFAVDSTHLVVVKKDAVVALFPATKDVLAALAAAPNPAAELTSEQMAALAQETAKKGKFIELQEIRSQNQHLGGQWQLEQPFKQMRFWCVLQDRGLAAPRREFLAVGRNGKVSYPFKQEEFAAASQAEDRSKWTDKDYVQAAALRIHLTGTAHQDGWKILDSADDFMAIKFNMFPQNEAKRAAAAKPIEKPKVVKDQDTVQVRLWAWHLIGGGLREWTVEFKPSDVKASSKDHGRFGGGGYD